jgi:phytoene dehydrogenase-like protein
MTASGPTSIRDRCRAAYDAIVVGSGPNGLTAAITLARTGRSVLVVEAQSTLGGGARSEAHTLPGFLHDVCSAVHPLGAGSWVLRDMPLREHGLDWVFPEIQLAHPFPDGRVATLMRSVGDTADSLGPDRSRYRGLMGPIVRDADLVLPALLGPLLRLPRHLLPLARLGALGLLPAETMARIFFRGEVGRGFLAGVAAHSILALDQVGTSSYGLVLALLGHTIGWPVARGGSQRITDSLVSYLHALGGETLADAPVQSIDDLPPARVILFDTTPRGLLQLAGDRLSPRYSRALRRFRYGHAAFKVDWALDGPVPWRAEEPGRAATVHLGATLPEIAASEAAMASGRTAERPFVLVAQPTLIDPTRAPRGKHTLWAYCHVPTGSTVDMRERIEAQIERFAPGFRDLVLARHVTTPADFEAHNANYIGGDIGAGAGTFRQLLARPVLRLVPYETSTPGLYLCSASTPPGAGVHGFCGYFAARAAIEDMDGVRGLRRLRSRLISS